MVECARTTTETGERLLGGYGGRLLLLVSVGWLTIQAGRLVLSPLLPSIIADLGITSVRAGLALSVLWGFFALSQYPSGRLADRLSRKVPIVGGLVLAAGGFAVLATALTYPVFVLGAAVVGVGAGLYPTAARVLIADHFRAKRGGAFGLHTALGDIGGGAAAGLAVLALAVATWRGAFLPVLVVLAGVALAFHWLSRESYPVEAVGLNLRSSSGRLFTTPRTRRLILSYSLFAFAWQGTAGFLPTLLQFDKGFSPAFASTAFAGVFVVGALVKPTAGRLADRVAYAPVAAGALTVGAVALSVLLVARTPLVAGVAVLGYGVGLMAYPPVMQSYMMEAFTTESAGADFGLARTVYLGFGALGPVTIGFVAGRADYVTAFVAVVVALVAATLVVVVESRLPA